MPIQSGCPVGVVFELREPEHVVGLVQATNRSTIIHSTEACCGGLKLCHRKASSQVVEESRSRGDYFFAAGEPYAYDGVFERAVGKAVSNVSHEI